MKLTHLFFTGLLIALFLTGLLVSSFIVGAGINFILDLLGILNFSILNSILIGLLVIYGVIMAFMIDEIREVI